VCVCVYMCVCEPKVCLTFELDAIGMVKLVKAEARLIEEVSVCVCMCVCMCVYVIFMHT
jgi:hypothetical protein